MESKSKYAKEVGGYKDRFWYPRIWNGMTLYPFTKLLIRNKFWIAPSRWCMALINYGCSFIDSSLLGIQSLTVGGKIKQTEIDKPPVFIVGHWRSGTTFLHELFVKDPRHAFPNCYECFSPNHFVISEGIIPKVVYLPNKRPMDNVDMSWTSPQEDEFALCNLGVPSPYINMAFPNNTKKDIEYLTLKTVSETGRKNWKDKLHWFMQALTYKYEGKRLVLKSPTHTARIALLRELYPDAKFVHIHRDPLTLFPSTVNLWQRLSVDNGFQHPVKDWDEYVFHLFDLMYESFWEDTANLPENQFANISFKELTGSPVETMERLYSQLELGDFEPAREQLIPYCEAKKSHKKNKYEIDTELQNRILEHPVWKQYMEKYGYLPE